MVLKSLDGSYPNEKKLVAFCKHHGVSLTVRQIKNKACLQKQCFHLSKYKHSYWENRAKIKAKAKEKHTRFNEAVNKISF